MKIIFTKLFNRTLQKQLAFCIVLLMSVNVFAQVTATEDFENETTVVNSSPHTFSESGISFSTTLKYQKNNGLFGYAASTSYIFFFNSINGVGQSETMTISNASTSFRINSFAAYIGNGASASGGAAANGTITFVGTLATGGTATATVNVASTGSVPSGQTRETNGMVNGLSFAGTPLAGAFITSLSVQSSATVQFIQLDHINFTTQAVVSNQFSISDVSQNEGNSGTSNFTFTVTRSSNAAASSVQVQSSNGTATSGTDYTAFPLTTVNFTAGGALTQTVNVVVNGDVSVEPNETFTMTLSNPSGGILLDATGTGTILDDDAINEPFEDETHQTSTFSQSGNNFQTTGKLLVKNAGNFGQGGTSGYASSTEPYAVGNQGSLQITSPGKSFNVISVDLWAAAVSGSAPNWTFTPTNGTITFTGTRADGSGTVTHTAAITSSGTNVHSTVLFATSPFNGVQLSAISFSTPTGIQYLQVDNFKYGTATLTNTQLSIDDVSVVEGTGGGSTTATFTVTRTNNTTAFTVNVASSDGTATAGTDYTAFPSTTLTFTSGGALSQTVNVTVLKDANIEQNEIFNMTLSGATNGTVYLKQTGIGAILNDDSVIETFETETNNSTTFSESGVSFSATGGYQVRQASTFGSGSSTYFLSSTNNAVGNQGTFTLTTANRAFKLNGLDAWVGTTATSHSSGSVTFTGTLLGGGTVSTTRTITATSATGAGWQLNVTFTGTPLDNVLLTAIQVTTAGAITECDIDNFNYTVVSTLPIIEVTDASNNAITNGGAAGTANNTDFGGACITGAMVDKTYTIKNVGFSNLTLSGSPLAVLGGTNMNQFSIITQPTSPIASSNSVNFTVRFSPTSIGVKNATITLTNNDPTNSPFVINLKGTGTEDAILVTVNSSENICSGESVILTPTFGVSEYTQGFVDAFAGGNWTSSSQNSDGSIIFNPTNTVMTSGNNGSNVLGYNQALITIPVNTTLTFNWSYTTADGAPEWDYPQYYLNGNIMIINGFNISGSRTQSGSQSIDLQAGDVFGFRIYTVDNGFGAATTTISNFQFKSVNYAWTASSGGVVNGPANLSTLSVNTLGSYTITATKIFSGCPSSNSIVVSMPPQDRNLINPTNNATSGNVMVKAIRNITATNLYNGTANVTYQAGKSILLSPGFSVSNSGAVFLAEIKVCN